MSSSICGDVSHCPVPRQSAPTRRMSFREAIQGVARHWRSRRQERRTFASLDSRDLHDLGVSQWDVEREIARPFWRD